MLKFAAQRTVYEMEQEIRLLLQLEVLLFI